MVGGKIAGRGSSNRRSTFRQQYSRLNRERDDEREVELVSNMEIAEVGGRQ